MLHVICDTWTCGDLEIWMVQWRILRYCVCHATCIGSSQQKWCRMNKLLHMWDAGTCRHVSTRARSAPCLCGTHARHVCVGTRLTRVGMRATRATWNGGSHICIVASANSSGRCADAGGGHPVVLASTRCNAVRADVTGMEVCDWLKRSFKEFVRK